MKIIKTKIKDLLIIKQKNNPDKRGSLRETFNKKIRNFSLTFTRRRSVAVSVVGALHWVHRLFPLYWQFPMHFLYATFHNCRTRMNTEIPTNTNALCRHIYYSHAMCNYQKKIQMFLLYHMHCVC